MKVGWDYPEAILLSGVIFLPFKGPPELVLLLVSRGGSGPQTLITEVFSCIDTLVDDVISLSALYLRRPERSIASG